jgi:hypothetical protein
LLAFLIIFVIARVIFNLSPILVWTYGEEIVTDTTLYVHAASTTGSKNSSLLQEIKPFTVIQVQQIEIRSSNSSILPFMHLWARFSSLYFSSKTFSKQENINQALLHSDSDSKEVLLPLILDIKERLQRIKIFHKKKSTLNH